MAGCEEDWLARVEFDDDGGSSTPVPTCLAASRVQALPICTW